MDLVPGLLNIESIVYHLAAFHVVTLGTVIYYQDVLSLQIPVFVFCSTGVFLSHKLNDFARSTWMYFPGDNPFDADGGFISLIWAGPLLFIALVQVRSRPGRLPPLHVHTLPRTSPSHPAALSIIGPHFAVADHPSIPVRIPRPRPRQGLPNQITRASCRIQENLVAGQSGHVQRVGRRWDGVSPPPSRSDVHVRCLSIRDSI